MKKIYFALVLVLALSMVLAACAGGAQTPQTVSDTTGQETTGGGETVVEEKEPVTLSVLIHQHPPLVEYMEAFNAKFEEAYPYVTVDMSVVNANDLATVTQTRLTANDIDVIDMAGFANASQPYMVDVVPPNWQTLIEAGLLMDLTGQPFLDSYQQAAIDTGSFDGKVYQIPVGTTIYSGVFYNKALFAEYGVEVPTTWDELVTACDTFAAADIPCMTSGGADGWPIFVGAYGLIGSIFPDQYALVEGLWDGTIKWNDAKALEMWSKMQVYARDFLETGASGLSHDGAPGRFASGAVAMLPMGTWNAAMIQAVDPEMDWGYFPFPGSDNPEDNQYWFGKYDMGWAAAANSENSEEALAYLAMLSDPENYQEFIDTVEFIPTQVGVTLDSRIGEEIAKYADNFRIGYEQIWIAPTGTGQWANPWASYFQPFNEWDDPQALADQAQADLQAGLDAVGK
ncbi:extracellular solute-binding protein [Chloroflexota bacterium]|nr:extracellular solute-binding protein [Chloroflexota bacterium]